MAAKPVTFVIDGYNLLPELDSSPPSGGDLEAARRRLEAWLRAFRRGTSSPPRLVLVYDGARTGLPTRSDAGGVEVRFALPPRKADDLIVEICRELEGSGDVRVVTSDLADIARRVRGLRVRHLLSREFVELVKRGADPERRAGDPPAGAGKPPAPTPQEADTWVEEFGLGKFPGEEE